MTCIFFSPQKHSKRTSLILQQYKVYEVSRLPTLTPSPLARFLTGLCPKCFLTEINSIPLACNLRSPNSFLIQTSFIFPHKAFPPLSFYIRGLTPLLQLYLLSSPQFWYCSWLPQWAFALLLSLSLYNLTKTRVAPRTFSDVSAD